MDGRITFGNENWLDGVAAGALSGGSWQPTLPLANLLSRQYGKVARSVGKATTATTLTVDFGKPRKVGLVSPINHNATLTGRLRIELSDKPSFAAPLIYDGTHDIWPGLLTSPWSLDRFEWEDDNFWLGGFTAEDIEGFRTCPAILLPVPKTARYMRLTFIDPDNPAGFIQVGRIFAGPTISPRINYSWGDTLTFEFATAIETSLGGDEFFDPRRPIRIHRFGLQHLSADEAYGDFLKMVRRQGVHKEVFIIPDPLDLFNGITRNFVGRLRAPSPLEQVQWEGDGPGLSMPFEIKEL